jgi:hypothetical protein
MMMTCAIDVLHRSAIRPGTLFHIPALSLSGLYRRPRNHTESADLVTRPYNLVLTTSARGLNTLRVITAGGELHPALRTSQLLMTQHAMNNRIRNLS